MTSAFIAIKPRKTEWEKVETFERYEDFEKWIWEECFNSMKLCAFKYGKTKHRQLLCICNCCHDLYFFEDQHCSFCHMNYSTCVKTLSFAEHVSQCKQKHKVINGTLAKLESSPPLRIRLLKAQLAFLEAALLPEALEAFWSEDYRISWSRKLQMASTAEELLQVLSRLPEFLVWCWYAVSHLCYDLNAVTFPGIRSPKLGFWDH